MMVDGSPRRVTVANDAQGNKATAAPDPPRGDNTAGEQGGGLPADSGGGPPPASVTSSGGTGGTSVSSPAPRTSRSRWLKLRTTVQLSGAITQVHKKPPLKREDSFLKRFSTRHIADPSSATDGSFRPGDSSRGDFLGSCRSVVNPDENILFYWLSLLTACLLYNAWTIIARTAFPELQEQISYIWYAADGFSDLVFVLDIAFQFRTGYLEQGLMVCEGRKLSGHYIRSRPFLMDLAAITPLDLLQLQVGMLPLLRFPRFLKVYRSFRFYYMVESRTIYPNLWRVVNLIHILLLLAHWFGCFYYMLSELEGFDGEWSYPKPKGDYATLARKYLGSVYWSTLTLTTIGDLATPATNLQYLFTIVSYLIGVFIFATIVGQVGNVITNRNASRLEFERLLDGAKLYMRHHKVPRNMQRRVQRWYDYSWSRGRMQGGGDIHSALGILPDKLKTELALHVNLKTLKKVSIFQECQPEFLHDLVLKMKAYIFTPGDLICRKGEVAREMFIIADGILEVISETGKVLTQMKAGDFFGEIGILNLDGFNRRTADVRSVGYSELFSLSREDILAAMKDYPEAQEILQTMGRKRLMEARLAATMGKTAKDEPPAASNKKGGVGDLGKKVVIPKPKTAVSKLKEDVRSLKKLLRSRSTPAGKGCPASEEHVELKQLPTNHGAEGNVEHPEDVRPTDGRRNASLRTLMRKIHFKGESEGSQGIKTGIASRLSSIRSRFHDSERSSESRSRLETQPSLSTMSSTESGDGLNNTPLNKGLPLLQRIRLLGEQERAAGRRAVDSKAASHHLPSIPPRQMENSEKTAGASGSTHEVIGEGLPLLERLKLLRARELAQGSAIAAANEPPSVPPPSIFKSRPSGSAGLQSHKPQIPSRLASIVSVQSVSSEDAIRTKPTPLEVVGIRGENQTKESKSRPSEFSQELPLLKKVLLMKMMEDKKTMESRVSSAPLTSSAPGPPVPTHSAIHQKTGGADHEPTVMNSRTFPVNEHPSMVKLSSADNKKSDGVSNSQYTNQNKLLDSKQPATVNSVCIPGSVPQSGTGQFRPSVSGDITKCTRSVCLPEKSNNSGNTVPDLMKVSSASTPSRSGEIIQAKEIQQPVTGEITPSVGYQSEQVPPPHLPPLPPPAPPSIESLPSDFKEQQDHRMTEEEDEEEEDPNSKTKVPVRKGSTTAELLQSHTEEGYSARKGLLTRMMALREDSDEIDSDTTTDKDSSDTSDDPFVKNIECQTEVHKSTSEASSTDSWCPQNRFRRLGDFPMTGGRVHQRHPRNGDGKKPVDDVSPFDDGIQDYLLKVMKNVKQAMKAYVLEQQHELQSKIAVLEKEVREKDALIRKLRTGLYSNNRGNSTARTSSTFDDVTSLDAALFSSSDTDNGNVFLPSNASVAPSPDLLSAADVIAKSRFMTQRNSWPSGGSTSSMRSRRKLRSSRQSYSLEDDATQDPSYLKAEELWKLEFPASESSHAILCEQHDEPQHAILIVTQHSEEHHVMDDEEEVEEEVEDDIDDGEVEEPDIKEEDDEEEQSEDEFPLEPVDSVVQGNDWEVQMLVHEFEKNVRQRRRHSSGEILSWDRVLGRNALRAAAEANQRLGEQKGLGQEEKRIPAQRGARKFSLIDDRLLRPWNVTGSSAPTRLPTTFGQKSMGQVCAEVSISHATSASNLKGVSSPGHSTDSSGAPSSRSNKVPTEKKSRVRRRGYRHRRQHSLREYTRSRNNSLPCPDALGLSRWLSLDDAKSRDTQNNNTVITNSIDRTSVMNIDPRCGSLEDISGRFHQRHNWSRSPSSPNFTADKSPWENGHDALPEAAIPEWPSSPCLPTITEDDQVGGGTLSSPCRSFSQDCLVMVPPSPLWTPQSTPHFPFQWAGDARNTAANKDRLTQDVGESRGHRVTDFIPGKMSDTNELEEDVPLIPFAQSREESVVITIPEHEPLLSPQ